MSRLWYGKMNVGGSIKDIAGVYVGESGKVVRKYNHKPYYVKNGKTQDAGMLRNMEYPVGYDLKFFTNGDEYTGYQLVGEWKSGTLRYKVILRIKNAKHLKEIGLTARVLRNVGDPSYYKPNVIIKEGKNGIYTALMSIGDKITNDYDFRIKNLSDNPKAFNSDGEFEVEIWVDTEMNGTEGSKVLQIKNVYGIKG